MTTENYHVGGNVPKNHPTYVYRQADTDFYQALKVGQFCYVLNARQMGKSSLLVRTRERLQQEGIACTTIDITQIGSDSTLIEWYAGIMRTILDDFQWDDFDLTDWWESHSLLSPLHHLSRFIEEVLLVRTDPHPVVIFVDETDAMRRFGEDFFAMIRSCYNLRADKPAYQRLTFAILGVVSPSDLIKDKKKTPFNIGKAIELTGFQLAEATPLLAGLETSGYPATALLPLILQWTGGQPFLTQKVCRLVKENAGAFEFLKSPLPPFDKGGTEGGFSQKVTAQSLESWLTQLLQEKVINNWEAQDEPAHLRNIRDRLLQGDEKSRARLLGLYQRILQTRAMAADGSSEQMELRLSGAVVQREGMLQMYNPIYAQVFGEQWVSAQLAAVRPYSEALQGWLGSAKQESSFLLRGQALQEAETWAQDKSLSDDDYRFLQASQALAQKEVEKSLRAKAQKQLISVLAASLVVAAGLMVWAWVAQERAVENERIAEQQRSIAVKQKELALQAVNNLTYDKMSRLLDVAPAKNLVLSIFENNIKTLEAIYALDPETKKAEREKSVNYNNIGDLWLQLGNTSAAVQAYEQSLEIDKRLATSDPDSTEAQYDLAISYERQGDIQTRLGNSQTALESYQKMIEISQKLVEGDPDYVLANRELSIGYEKLGDVQLLLGNTSAAVQAYEQSLEIRKRLATSDPDSTQAQRDLSVSYERLGDVQLRQGNTSAAVQAYEQDLEISKRLAASDPDSTQAQQDLAFSYERIGDVKLRLGESQPALEAYQREFEILDKLAKDDPDSLASQRALMVSYYKLAEVHLAEDELEEALTGYQSALTITEKLVAQDELNQQLQDDLAELKSKIDEVKQRLSK